MAGNLYDRLKHAIRLFLLRRVPTCQKTVELISQSMEEPLSLRERVAVKVHLWICSWCQWYMEHLQLIRDTVRAGAAEGVDMSQSSSAGLSFEARERIKRNLLERNSK